MHRSRHRLAPLVLLALTATVPLAGAQKTLLELEGDVPWILDELAVDFVPDVNGDGRDDLVVGQPSVTTFGLGAGLVRIHSGADQSVLLELHGAPGSAFGTAVAGLPDMDGDGAGEILVGAPDEPADGIGMAGRAFVFSGASGALLLRLGGERPESRFGESVDHAGDLDGDGLPDVVIGAPMDDLVVGDDLGCVRAFSGADGSLLIESHGSHFKRLGHRVRGGGDYDGDGVGDLLCSSYEHFGNQSEWWWGDVRVISGATGLLLETFTPPLIESQFGRAIDWAGDLDGDGRTEVLIGASYDETVHYGAGAVYLHAGGSGALLHTFLPPSACNCMMGMSVAGVGDMTGDGVPDFVIGERQTPTSMYYAGTIGLRSGADLSEVWRVYGKSYWDHGALSLRGGGDLDGDGSPDLLATAHGEHDTWPPPGIIGSGVVRAYGVASPECLAVTSSCTGAPNSIGAGARLDFTGTTSVAANDLQLHATEVPTSSRGLWVMGALQAPQPFGQGELCVAQPFIVVRRARSYTNWTVADLVLDLGAPAVAGLVQPGSSWTFQMLYRDPGFPFLPRNASDAVTATFCP
jgi:hypothetical protein